jgi:hypothetical protein
MPLISGGDYINPGFKYNLSSDFYIDEESRSVYVIDEPNYSNNNASSVINFSQIPFKSGRIKLLSKKSFYGESERVNVEGEMYNVRSSMPFNKGTYCGRQYDLAYKIAYISPSFPLSSLMHMLR